MFWLCFLWLHCVLAVAASAVEKCFLYPVDKDNKSPEFTLNDSGNTLITIHHLFNSTSSMVYLNKTCLVQVDYSKAGNIYKHKSPVQPDYSKARKTDVKCHTTLSTNNEYAKLVTRRLTQQRVGVHLADSQEDECVVSNVGEYAALYVTTKNSINVAYDCPGRCFQFERATVHKSFADTSNGSLLFYSKAMGNQEHKGNIQILRGSTGWDNHTSVPIQNNVSASDWVKYTVEISFSKNDNTFQASGRVIYTNSPNGNFSLNVTSQDLYMRFNETSNMRWAIYCETTGSIAKPGKTITALASTPTTSNSSRSFAGSSEHSEDLWFAVVLALCVLLLITVSLLIVCIYRQCKYMSSAAAPLIPHNTPTASNAQNGHEYGHIDLNKLTLSEAQGERRSYSSINSIYGYVDTASTPASQ